MKVVLVTGSRSYRDRKAAYALLDELWEKFGPFILRHGACRRGGDRFGHDWAEERGVVQDPMPADWEQYGREAGPIRNEEMLDKEPVPVAVAAFPMPCVDQKCRWPKPHFTHGTAHTMTLAEKLGIPVYRPHTQQQGVVK